MLALATILLAGGRAAAETPAEALTRGRLEADIGQLASASAAFAAVAHASDASAEQHWEALVRLGSARRSAGDADGSVAAFEEVWTTYGQDPEAIRFLLQALGSALPGQERWDEVWQAISFTVDRGTAEKPFVRVKWPGASAVERAASRQTVSVDFKNGNLVDIFRLLADVSGLNVVVQPGIGGTVTILAKDLPWDELLGKVLAPYGLLAHVDGNVLWIGQPGSAPHEWVRVSGEPFDFDFQNAPLERVLGQIAARGGARVVVPVGVGGNVTIRLKALPWQQALDLVATTHSLTWERQGDVITVRPRPKP